MNWRYTFKHWGTTLIIGPVIMIILGIIFLNMGNSPNDTLLAYCWSVIYGLIFSLPTLLGYIILFFVIRNISPIRKKTLLILWTIIGIVVTLILLGGLFSKYLIPSYALPAIFSGIIFKISKSASIEETSQPVV